MLFQHHVVNSNPQAQAVKKADCHTGWYEEAARDRQGEWKSEWQQADREEE